MTHFFEFRVDTNKGRFYAGVDAESCVVAEARLVAFMTQAATRAGTKLVVNKIRPLKRAPSGDNNITLWGDDQNSCGRAFWYAMGRGIEYEAILSDFKGEAKGTKEDV